jgi:hypothetical protein
MILDRVLSLVNSFKNILDVLNMFEQGSVVLQNGNHVIEVKTRQAPLEVWLNVADDGNLAVCGGDINKTSTELLVDGFILYADVSTDTVHIKYTVVYGDE